MTVNVAKYEQMSLNESKLAWYYITIGAKGGHAHPL